MMQAAGAGPAVRAAVNRFVAEARRDSTELLLDEIERFIPGDRNEFVAAAQVSRLFSMPQVSGPDIGTINPEIAANDFRQAVVEGRGMRVAPKRRCSNNLAVIIRRDVIHAPMRCRLDRSCIHCRRSRYVTLRAGRTCSQCTIRP